MKKAIQHRPDLATRVARLEIALCRDLYFQGRLPIELGPTDAIKWYCDELDAHNKRQYAHYAQREGSDPEQNEAAPPPRHRRHNVILDDNGPHPEDEEEAPPLRRRSEKYTEWDRLNDIALVRGFEVLRNSDPDNVGGKYTVWSLDSRNPDKVDDIEHQADSADEVLEFLNHYPVYRKQGYDQRLTVQAAQKRLDDAVLTLTLRALKDEDKNEPPGNHENEPPPRGGR